MEKFFFRLRGRSGILALLPIVLAAACNEPAPTNGKPSARRDTTAAADTGRAATAASADPAVTLPILDALFYEEGFEGTLKQQLSLTDEQVASLKKTASESTADLSEDGAAGGYSGSARAAAKHSDEQIRAILGDQKAGQLYSLVAQRYAGGDVEGLMPTEPNAVPKDTRIVVNAPAYRMDVFQDGKLTKTYKIGIGYPEFPLPTGMRRAESIIFNPTWTPPDEPWVKGKFKPGQKVEAGSNDNPLGPIKIPIGLPSLIHGGKAPAKLGAFASHGCVGLTNAQVQEFAGVLASLSGSPLSTDSIAGFGKKKTETKDVKLSRPVPVELRYETIVVEAGGVRIFRDVYERGTNTREALDRVLQVYGLSFDKLSAAEQQALTAALQEMDRDAKGNPISGSSATDSTAVASSDTGKGGASTEARAKKGKETKTVVGRKEVAVPVAALNGKGYPVPVALNAGG